ncbi:5-methylcytosine-specific restriction endonuclease system specificity protein McrC [Parashewanella spongiae]|uniref:5-methylcytosine-specific restriction endonuclease system specificity protein McrC n=1 Tax=Parashewanella spongiae TaxID=342950 RepID=A0A3A6U3V7_9GAMM|nr:5-methylcytosine-specific restriction endonuclease system specificity protein McrC [Parashewanella spongiae]MCL1078701.1 5-methylcytosine-specific restriction endonuclease system specificity protein McrC [Parashewanella spongiae]RJY12272.1 5-methylcytosine-specific restriction endonuclease system specificity protein McrC [Parashewanella spongiae]
MKVKDSESFVQYSAGIPVRNLWLLMLYASDFKYLASEYCGSESIDENVADLVADILCSQVETRLKRNLTFGYRRTSGELTRIRGKINSLETFSNQLLLKGKVSCNYEELSIDTPRNRYICAALEKISSLVTKKSIKSHCVKLRRQMVHLGVSHLYSIDYSPKNDRFGRHEKSDKQTLIAAELAFNLALINESSGNKEYPRPDKQEHWVRDLFEKAISGFYKMKLSGHWKLKPKKKIQWQAEDKSSNIDKFLPTMEVDIFLESKYLQKRIFIDTKFTGITRKNRFQQDRFKRDYIFQLYSYLRSQESDNDQFSLNSTGMLLHPSIGVNFNEQVTIQGHIIRFCTVDLTLSSSEIHKQLLALIY